MNSFKLQKVLAVAGLVMVAGLTVPTAQAVPAFARQTGMACLSCHFQNFPALNAFGRSFRAGGYTMRGAQTLVEGDDLSLPSTLNMSVITKLRYQMPETAEGGRGEVQWPDEAALLVGGRAGERVGFLMELNLGGNAATGEGTVEDTNGNGTIDEGETVVVESDTHANFLSAKFHMNVTDKFSMVLFGTDALGASYGFEGLNTGMQRSQRPIENRSGMSATQALGLDGNATGLTFLYMGGDYFINYSHFSPTWSNVNANVFGGLGHYLRAAYTPNIAGWDMGVGIASWSGTIKHSEAGVDTTTPDETKMGAWVMDAQAQGALGESMSLGVWGSYGKVEDGAYQPGEESFASADTTAYAMAAKLGMGNWRPYLAYSSTKASGADAVTVTTVGFQYAVAQNINVEVFNVGSSKADADYSMISLFAGF